jgi:hypothetical protein
MGSTHIREGYFTRFDRPNLSPTNSAVNHHVLSLFSPSLLNHCVVAVPPLFVDILDPPPTEPGVVPSSLDTGRCGWCVRNLMEAWRARNGAGKGKRDALLAALYVSDLGMKAKVGPSPPATCSTHICSSHRWCSLRHQYPTCYIC